MSIPQRKPEAAKWPKQLAPLTAEQQRISHEFMKMWHEVLPNKYGFIEAFNHRYPLRSIPPFHGVKIKTLEIGAGIGGHLAYEPLEQQEYYAVELRENMATVIRQSYPSCHVVTGDCQQKLDFPNSFFDRILAIHVLEHLPNLPAALKEIHRLLKPGGQFSVVIPCEGGLAYGLGRRVSAQRIFEKTFKQPYDWFIKNEHINLPHEIMEELALCFTITHQSFFPFMAPSVNCNLCIGLTLSPKT